MKAKHITHQTDGFTLIELLIVLSISAIVLGAAFQSYIAQQRNTTTQNDIVEAQQTLRAINNVLTNQIRTAGAGTGATITSISNNASITYTDASTGALQTITFNIPGNNQLTQTGGANPGILSTDIEAIGFAYAFDADGDLIVDTYIDAGGTTRTIWAVDTDGDNILDTNLDTNNDGIINECDIPGGCPAPTAFPNAILTGTALGTLVPMTAIRAVRTWTLARTNKANPKFLNTTTYVVGNQAITPSSDGNLTNDNFPMRVSTNSIKCYNMGLINL